MSLEVVNSLYAVCGVYHKWVISPDQRKNIKLGALSLASQLFVCAASSVKSL